MIRISDIFDILYLFVLQKVVDEVDKKRKFVMLKKLYQADKSFKIIIV